MTRPHVRGVALVVALLGVLVAGCSDGAGGSNQTVKVGPTRPATTYVLPSCPDLPHQPAVKGGLPDLTLPCLGDGPAVDLADLRGTPTVLSVWAAWCEPCSEEMPVLARGMRRADGRVQFFGVHYKAPTAFAKRSAKDFGVAFPSVQDADGDTTTLTFRPLAGPPQTFFYAADGTLAGRHPGAIRTAAQLDALVQQYLGVRL